MSYIKLPPIKQFYRNYKRFNPKFFQLDLNKNLKRANINNFSDLNLIFSSTLNAHAPTKEKLIRGNHKPFISKALKKEMMKRAHLKNILNKTNSKTDHNNYKRQRNLVVALTKKEKK